MKPSAARLTLLLLVSLIQMTAVLGSQPPSSAARANVTSADQVDQSFRISVTNAETHVDYPATLLVQGATLTTSDPSDSGASAPANIAYLTLNMSAEPAQTQYGDATWGDFYSNLDPLPATALRYVTSSGRSYMSTRVDVDTQASFANADGNDGLVDATYYFTIPIGRRNGTLEILPSRTSGMRYENFQGVETTTLVTGGPTRIPLHFPIPVAAAAKASTTKVARVSDPPFATFASMLNFASTILGLFMLAAVYLLIRRARRRHSRSRRPVYFTHQGTGQSPPVQTETHASAVPSTRTCGQELIHSEADERLHVNVLGSLTISPTDGPVSDPVRAIVAYLAMHTERPLTLDEIQNAIWPLTDKGNDIKRPAMRNYMANARKAVGDRHLPTAAGRAGYQLVDATTDWSEFQRLIGQAASAAKPATLNFRKEALSLVRGEPFTADTSRYFTWAFSSAIVYKIVESVTTLAHSLGTELVLASDLGGAEWAVRQGLLCDPASMTLWEDLTDVLLETADQSLLDLHWKAAALVLEPKDVVSLRSRENG